MIIPPGFLGASYELRLGGFARSAFVTCGHENDTGSNDPVALASALLDTMIGADSFQGLLDSQVVMASCTVRLGQDGGEPLVGVDTGTIAGSRNSLSPAGNVAVLVHKRTASGGRRNRGRFFLPWHIANTNILEDGTIDSTTVAALQTDMNGWRTALVAASLPPVVLHSTGLTVPPAPTPITTFQVDNLVATQRRRLGRT